ncbi:hypothetical protein [Sphingomonas sp. UYP23]
MSSNVIAFPSTCPSLTASFNYGLPATVIQFPTAKDRKLANKIKASRLFSAAETLWDMDPGATRPVEMMMELACECADATYREKAATWLWQKSRIKVVSPTGTIVSRPLRRARAQHR